MQFGSRYVGSETYDIIYIYFIQSVVGKDKGMDTNEGALKGSEEQTSDTQRLPDRLRKREQQANTFSLIYFGLIGGGIGLVLTSWFFAGSISALLTDYTIFIFVAGVMWIAASFFATKSSENRNEIVRIQGDLVLVEAQTASSLEKAEKIFRLNETEVRRYYDEALKKSSWIFYVGVGTIVIGFLIVWFTIRLVSSNAVSDDLPGKIVLAVLGTVSGVLTNFIAAIYIKMYSETIQSLGVFHNRLVLTHHLHFANVLVEGINDKSLRDETLSKLAAGLVYDTKKEAKGEDDKEKE